VALSKAVSASAVGNVLMPEVAQTELMVVQHDCRSVERQLEALLCQAHAPVAVFSPWRAITLVEGDGSKDVGSACEVVRRRKRRPRRKAVRRLDQMVGDRL
jgi:hypothetical protein